MGAIYEMNWILKLGDDQLPEVEAGGEYEFSKEGLRVYPIDYPIDLVNQNWEAIARCVVSSVTLAGSTTTGTYRVIAEYGADERAVLTKVWRDTLSFRLGERDVEDYSQRHIS